MSKALNAKAALEFVRKNGIVLVSAQGKAPRLIEAILGQPISGNWWAHPKANFIFRILSEVTDSEDVLVCRLLNGKLTLVHRRLWPALVRASKRFDKTQLAQVTEEHTSSGRHINREIAFPRWVPAEAKKRAKLLSEAEALEALGPAAQLVQRKTESTSASLRLRGRS